MEKEQQEKIFSEFYESLQKCENIDCLKENFLEITKNKNKISPEQYKNLASLKDDMKISLEKKSEKIETAKEAIKTKSKK